MQLRDIPFNVYFEKLMCDGAKTATSRIKRYGYAGDSFKAFGRCFVLTAVDKKPLGEVANHYYQEEGFSSPQEFIDFWNKLHPKKKFQIGWYIYFHQFQSASKIPFHIHDFENECCVICGYDRRCCQEVMELKI